VRTSRIGSFVLGFCELTLSEVAQFVPEFFDGLGILCTMFDSGPGFSQRVEQALLDSTVAFHQTLNGCWLPAPDAVSGLRKSGLLSHFDEIYLAAQKPADFALVEHFTSDRFELLRDDPKSLLDYIGGLGASRFLSDGAGLNFVCDSDGLALKLAQLESRVTQASS
jgi:hypothetical protein